MLIKLVYEFASCAIFVVACFTIASVLRFIFTGKPSKTMTNVLGKSLSKYEVGSVQSDGIVKLIEVVSLGRVSPVEARRIKYAGGNGKYLVSLLAVFRKRIINHITIMEPPCDGCESELVYKRSINLLRLFGSDTDTLPQAVISPNPYNSIVSPFREELWYINHDLEKAGSPYVIRMSANIDRPDNASQCVDVTFTIRIGVR